LATAREAVVEAVAEDGDGDLTVDGGSESAARKKRNRKKAAAARKQAAGTNEAGGADFGAMGGGGSQEVAPGGHATSRAADGPAHAIETALQDLDLSEPSEPRAAASAAQEGLPEDVLLAADRGEGQPVVAWLDEGGGVDAQCAESKCMTLLMAAAAQGWVAMVRMLLQRGASVNLQDPNGCNALIGAASTGQTLVVQALLDAKADASLETAKRFTALDLAELYQHTETAQVLQLHDERQAAEAEAKAATAAAELLAEEAEEKEAASKAAKPKGKKKKAKAAPPSTDAAGSAAAASSTSAPTPAAAEEGRPEDVTIAATEGTAQAVAASLHEGGDVNARCADVGDASLHDISGQAKAPVEPPDEYLCPITQELMHDPVIASDGHTYERDAIERWFSKKLFSPKTGSDLETSAVFPNHVMRRQIIEWKEVHQEA